MKRKVINYLILVIIMILISGIYAFCIVESKDCTGCIAKEGKLNLENWNWSKYKTIELRGEWKFYPDSLKEDIKPQTYSLIKKIPHYWESDSDMDFSPYGFGTYELNISGLEPSGIYALEILDEVTAYNLYVNNLKIASNGTVSKEIKTYKPQWDPSIRIFQADKNGEASLVMEIANYDYNRGGFWNSIKIGNLNDIIAGINKDRVIDLVLFTSIFIIGLFNIGLFFISKRDKAPLFFALLCFSISFRIIITGQRIITDLVSIDWNVMVRMEYLLGYMLLPLFGLFFVHLFESQSYKIFIKRLFETSIFCLSFTSLLTPHSVYTSLLEPYKWATLIFALYFISFISKFVKYKHEEAILMLFAVLSMIVSLYKEIFIGGQVSWIPFASFNFVICFSIITFQQFLNVIRKNEFLEKQVIIDSLTGLYNRNYLMGLKDNHSYELKYMMFLDLDKFKNINDTYGHKIGDLILQETSKRLQNIIRDTDITCRYGGDEFVIIINSARLEHVKKIAERIIQAVKKPYEINSNKYYIGVSIGITDNNSNSNNIETLIKESDEAMYEAKKNGGNQYVIIQEPTKVCNL